MTKLEIIKENIKNLSKEFLILPKDQPLPHPFTITSSIDKTTQNLPPTLTKLGNIVVETNTYKQLYRHIIEQLYYHAGRPRDIKDLKESIISNPDFDTIIIPRGYTHQYEGTHINRVIEHDFKLKGDIHKKALLVNQNHIYVHVKSLIEHQPLKTLHQLEAQVLVPTTRGGYILNDGIKNIK